MMTDETTAPAVAMRRFARGGWTLAGHIRRRLRERPHMTRADLREWLRRDRLLTCGTRGAARLVAALRRMAAQGELQLTPVSVTALHLRRRRSKPRRRPRLGTHRKQVCRPRIPVRGAPTTRAAPQIAA